ncbi:Leucine efflux protein [Streptomyces sp. YIM 130001]|uniref:LysE family translocator n=1 Tax=Streptomyces sp. YIM 130001 TaxID=2259644 RepID=UPI000E649946|nr:LysE family translocator [Streptomyces sp. YIM 130001]RII17923.1 Leucine efflux protein [Streptomyces sp. YIM 130001]
MTLYAEWAAFFPAALVVSATPGANQLLTLRNGMRHGLRPALSASAGRFAAFALMVIAVAAGLGAVLLASEVAFNIIKWCGVAYLLWLGGRTLITAARGRAQEYDPPPAAAPARGEGPGGHSPETKSGSWRLARQEFLVAASNPKALILFAVFLPQFVPAGADHAAVSLLALGAAYIGVEFCCAWGYAAVGGRLKKLGMRRRSRRLLDALTGTAMVGLAGWLATENR